MSKIYYITESQFKALVEKKKQEKVHLKNIIEEISRKKSTINESTSLNESIVGLIKPYVEKGVMSISLASSLMKSKYVNEQQLIAAGVSKDQIKPTNSSGKL